MFAPEKWRVIRETIAFPILGAISAYFSGGAFEKFVLGRVVSEVSRSHMAENVNIAHL